MLNKEHVIDLFEIFSKEFLECRFSFGTLLPEEYEALKEEMENNGCNQYLETEDDYKIKLGGFLEEQLRDEGFTVHAEMNRLYDCNAFGKRVRPDLTIHKVSVGKEGFWRYDDERRRSLCCVMELKDVPVKCSSKSKIQDNVRKDFIKLASLNNGNMKHVIKCMVIFDQAQQVEKEWFDDESPKIIQNNDILLLSNNREIHCWNGK